MSRQNQSSKHDVGSDMTAEDIVAKMDSNRRNMLTHLYHADHGQLASGEIADRAGVKRGSKHSFLMDLVGWGLIEKRGTRETGSGSSIDEDIYGITDDGRVLVTEHLEDVRPSELSERIELLETQVDELQSHSRDHSQDIEVIRDKQEENSDRLDSMKKLLNGDYWKRIVSEIEKRS